MTKRLFITATNTDVGKTYTTLRLLETYSNMGFRVGVFKPIETGVETLPIDGKKLYESAIRFNPDLKALELETIVPIRLKLPAAPYVANNCESIDWDRIDASLQKIESFCDIVLIEGAGGLFVPIDDTRFMIDMPNYFNAAALLVSHCRLGCINDTLLSLNALRNKRIPHVWAYNCLPDDNAFETVSLPYYRKIFSKLYSIQNDIDALAHALLDTIALD